jgi:hypothetical protein
MATDMATDMARATSACQQPEGRSVSQAKPAYAEAN